MPFPQPPFNSPVQTEPSLKGKVSIKAVWQNWLQLVQIFLADLTNFGPTEARPTENLWVGMPFFDTTLNVPVYWNGGAWVTASPSGTVTAVTGTAPIASSGGTTPNISITQSGSTSDGYLSSADWNTFNNKQPAGTYVNSVGAVSPVVSTGGTAPVISMPAANSSTNGYLTSTDWSTFNSTSNRNFVDVDLQYGPSYGGRTSAAIQAAINANPGRTIYLRGGTTNDSDYWKISSTVTITRGCTLVGDGVFTLLFPYHTDPNNPLSPILSNAPLIDIETTEQVCIDNMQILGNHVTGIDGIKVSGGAGKENLNSRFSRLDVYACTTGILFYSAYNWTLVDSIIHDCDSQGVYITEVVDQDHGDCLISGCEFGQKEFVGYCINQVGMGGIRIIGNKFINGRVHWLVVPNGNPVNDAIFEGNSSENASEHHIYLDGTNGVINNFVISGNQIALAADKSNVTGIRLTGDGIDSPCQTNIMGNTIWVRHTNQTGIAITSGGYDGNCYNTIYVANNNLYSQNGPSGQYAIAFQNIASVRCGVNNIAWNLSNPASNWAARYVISTSQTCIYDLGQSQNGDDVDFIDPGKTRYGSFYVINGGFGSGGNYKRHNFPNAFPVTPSVKLTLWGGPGGTGNTAGAITLILGEVTTTYFDWFAAGNNPSGYVYIQWEASLTGQ